MTTIPDTELLTAGDLVWVDLRPTRGREQSGIRPAVVLTDAEFHRVNATAIICSITSDVQPSPTKVILPDGLAVSGEVLTDQIRSVDRASRGFRRIGSLPESVMAEIRLRIPVLIGAAPGSVRPDRQR